jgi:hypothetical protein
LRRLGLGPAHHADHDNVRGRGLARAAPQPIPPGPGAAGPNARRVAGPRPLDRV